MVVTVEITDADDPGKVELMPGNEVEVGQGVTATLTDEDGKSNELWTWKRGTTSPGTTTSLNQPVIHPGRSRCGR